MYTENITYMYTLSVYDTYILIYYTCNIYIICICIYIYKYV